MLIACSYERKENNVNQKQDLFAFIMLSGFKHQLALILLKKENYSHSGKKKRKDFLYLNIRGRQKKERVSLIDAPIPS